MVAYFQYRSLAANSPSPERAAAPVLSVFLVAVLLTACGSGTGRELQGTYATVDGLAQLEFLPGGRYVFRDQILDISITGEYFLADARRLFLRLPLQRADARPGAPLLLRHRDELRMRRADGVTMRFFRRRDARDGAERLLGELKPGETLAETRAESLPDTGADTLPPEVTEP